MKLTRSQRLTAYLIMLETIDNEKSMKEISDFSSSPICRHGLCHLVNHLFGFTDNSKFVESILNVISNNFPELHKALESCDGYTSLVMGDWVTRREILVNVINKMILK